MPRVKFHARSNPFATDTFRLTRHKIQEDMFTKLSLLLSGTFVQLKTKVVNNLLTSSSLMTNYYQHLMIRNGEIMSQSFIRKILGILDPKHPTWKYSYDQKVAKFPQYESALRKLALEKKSLEVKFKIFNEGNNHSEEENRLDERNQIKARILKVEETINKMRLILEYMEQSYQGSMHPDPGAINFSEEDVGAKGNFLVGPNSPWRIRGMMIRIAGANKGQRAQAWKKYVGSYSMNSVGFVNAEESKVQMLTQQGTYGLTIRIIWEKIEDMPNSNLSLTSDGGFTFYEPFSLSHA